MDFHALVTEFKAHRPADRAKCENLETLYAKWALQCNSAQTTCNGLASMSKSISSQIRAAREEINKVLSSCAPTEAKDITFRVNVLETENKHMKGEIAQLKDVVAKLQAALNISAPKATTATKPDSVPKSTPKPKEADDEIDLFASDDEEDAEAAKIREERLKAYAEKKSKKPGPIAKSSVILDVKPWDDETDMAQMEKQVRSIAMDGLLWGASKLMPVGYGIKKLQIMCVVEDEKVSIDELQETIGEFEDFVQSVDIAAFNKI